MPWEGMARVSRRAVTAGLLVVGGAVSLGLTGCHATSGLTTQEIVVVFKTDATQVDHTAVWKACQNLPGVVEEPLVSTSKYKSTLLNNVRFRVDKASNYQLQQLYTCLTKQSSVSGYNTDGSDDEG
jgi:hypothetical protein